MSDVTRILSMIEAGDPSAAEKLLPLVYNELRRLAAAKMAKESPGQTLQATALVHEAYLRLVDVETVQHWDSRGHFFAAAAEAMRRILVERSRRKRRTKHGGDRRRVSLENLDLAAPSDELLLALDDAIDRLGTEEPRAADLVKLRCFAGMSMKDATNALGLSDTTAHRCWVYAKAWLRCDLASADS